MFIIVAIVVASIKYLFSDNYKAIYNDLVVGKSGDTVQITKVPVQKLSAEIQKILKMKKNQIQKFLELTTKRFYQYRLCLPSAKKQMV